MFSLEIRNIVMFKLLCVAKRKPIGVVFVFRCQLIRLTIINMLQKDAFFTTFAT